MKKTSILSLILFVLVIKSTFSQDWQMIRSGRIAHFEYNSEPSINTLKTVKADSFSYVSGDTIIYFSKGWSGKLYDDECIPFDSSWLSKEMIIKDSMNIFSTSLVDSIVFLPTTPLDSSWIICSFQDTSTIYFKATVTKEETNDVLDGWTDKVKTIRINTVDSSNQSVAHIFDNYEIRVGRTFGIISFFSIKAFPYDTTRYELAGLENEGLGVKNITAKEIYDYNPGDVIQHTIHQQSFGADPSSNIDMITYTQDSILSVIKYQDSIEVTKQSIIKTYTTPFHSIGETFSESTNEFKQTIRFDDYKVNLGLYELNINSDTSELYTNYQIIDSEFGNQKTVPSKSGYMIGDSCFNLYPDAGSGLYKYYEGAGGPYYYFSVFQGFTEKALKYVKKGSIEMGQKIDFSVIGVKDEEKNNIKLFPNPVKDVLNIHSNSKDLFDLEIYNGTGQKVLEQRISGKSSIKMQHLPSGPYFYIINKNNSLHSGKILKY